MAGQSKSKKKRPHNLTASRLRELLIYSPDVGVFQRIKDTHKGRWKAGAIVGSADKHGYLTIWIDGTSYKAHRLAWLYVNGEWPTGELDHINGVRSDNRIANLRPVSSSEQKWNCKTYSHNTSGRMGVRMGKSGRFYAYIGANNKRIYLGWYDTFEDACIAREQAEKKYHSGYTRQS